MKTAKRALVIVLLIIGATALSTGDADAQLTMQDKEHVQTIARTIEIATFVTAAVIVLLVWRIGARASKMKKAKRTVSTAPAVAGKDAMAAARPYSLNTVRTAALFEAAKGVLVILTGLGALSLIHHDVQQFAERLVRHMHLDPAKHFPQIFLDAAAHLTDARLWMLAVLATLYGLVRFIEAYGLWGGRRWAEWFAAVSGGIYIPFEIYELFRGVNWLSVGALAVNVLIVGVMVNALSHARPADSKAA